MGYILEITNLKGEFIYEEDLWEDDYGFDFYDGGYEFIRLYYD
jgi:hypothetical protein